jgi:cytochrome c peroxidase
MRIGGLFMTLCLLTSIDVSQATEAVSREAYKRPEAIPSPSSNPLTEEKAVLGKSLFFDPRLSRHKTMSCTTCHAPDKRWSDGRMPPLQAENIPNARRTPTVLNSAWLTTLMWDGRAASLEAQAVLPITTPHEMNFDMPALLERLQKIPGYRPLFAKAFGDDVINQQRVSHALASFQRTLVSQSSPFDRWVAGDELAISESAKRGFVLFNDKARCVACHKSWRFTDDSFHDIGLSSQDLGRGAHVPQAITLMQHAFKTPSLRDLPVQGPYMHDGSMFSLEEVIKHYEEGGIPRNSRSAEMKPFELTDEERTSLINFLGTLDGGPLSVEKPRLPE